MLPPPQARRGPPPIGLARSIRSLPRYRLRLPVPKSIRPAIVRSHHHFRTDRPHRQIYRVKRRGGPLSAHRTKDGIVDCIPNGLIVHEYTSCGNSRAHGTRIKSTHGAVVRPRVLTSANAFFGHLLSPLTRLYNEGSSESSDQRIDSFPFCDARKLRF